MVDSSDVEEQFGYGDANLHVRLYTVETTMITTQNTQNHTQKFSLPTCLRIFLFKATV